MPIAKIRITSPTAKSLALGYQAQLFFAVFLSGIQNYVQMKEASK